MQKNFFSAALYNFMAFISVCLLLYHQNIYAVAHITLNHRVHNTNILLDRNMSFLVSHT